MLIRPATPSDTAALGRLGGLLVRQHQAWDPARFIPAEPETDHWYGTFLASQLDRPDVVILVAEQDGRVIGFVYAGLEDTDWMAEHLNVHPRATVPQNRFFRLGGQAILEVFSYTAPDQRPASRGVTAMASLPMPATRAASMTSTTRPCATSVSASITTARSGSVLARACRRAESWAGSMGSRSR